MRRAASLILALCSAGASVLVAGYGAVVGTLRCLDSCSVQGGDWAESGNAWQWDAAVGFSLALFLGALILLAGIAIPKVRNLGVLVAILALTGEIVALGALWELITSSARKQHLKGDFVWLALTIVITGGTSIILRTQRKATSMNA